MKATIYISEAVNNFSSDELSALADNAAMSNAKAGVSGYLWYNKGQFLQYLEGDNSTIDKLILMIGSDKRHNILNQISTDDITEAKFPNWHMKRFQHDEMIEINLEKILIDQLLFLKSASITDSKIINGVWRLTDSLAKYNQF